MYVTSSFFSSQEEEDGMPLSRAPPRAPLVPHLGPHHVSSWSVENGGNSQEVNGWQWVEIVSGVVYLSYELIHFGEI